MKKLWSRLLTFIIGFPTVMLIVYLPYFKHLAVNLTVITLCTIGSIEFCKMVENKTDKFFSKVLMAILTFLQLAGSYILLLFELDLNIILWVLVIEIILLMAIEVFTQRTFEFSSNKLGLGTLCLFYCGYLPTFIIKMCQWENSTFYIALFLVIVFMCDSSAWFIGMLFGKHSRGVIAASPNKSLIGFIGGLVGANVFGTLMWVIFPSVFNFHGYIIIVISTLTGLCAIIGDLIESVLKRSFEVKDSGTLIPGRGGVLDSIDSIVVSAPIFAILVHFLVQL